MPQTFSSRFSLSGNSSTTSQHVASSALPHMTGDQSTNKPVKRQPVSDGITNSSRDSHLTHPTSSLVSTAPCVNGKQSFKKNFRPFRVKVGCVVALRYLSGGNHVTDCRQESAPKTKRSKSYVEVWTDPIPGRDDGLALLGRRLRCIFPKWVLHEQSSTTGQQTPLSTTRVLEGEVISIVELGELPQRQRRKRTRREAFGTTVELLVDKQAVPHFLAPAPDPEKSTQALTDAEKRRRGYEERIRGKNKIIVQITLENSVKLGPSTISKENDRTQLVAKWVLRKRIRVPKVSLPRKNDSVDQTKDSNGQSNKTMKSNIEKAPKQPLNETTKKHAGGRAATMTRYVGDENDSASQQEANWRWLAKSYAVLPEDVLKQDPGDFSTGLIGEVMKVAPSSSPSASTLAVVTIRRLWIPEQTQRGRLSKDGIAEIFDDVQIQNERLGLNPGVLHLFDVPIEELLVIGQKVERGEKGNVNMNNAFSVSKLFVAEKNVLFPCSVLKQLVGRLGEGNDAEKTMQVPLAAVTETCCHRCRVAILQMKTNITGQDEASSQVRTCESCRRILNQIASYVANAKGDCIRSSSHGMCDCRPCQNPSEETLKSSVSKFVQSDEEIESRTQSDDSLFNDDVSYAQSQNSDLAPVGFLTKLAEQIPPVDFHLSPRFFGQIPTPFDIPHSKDTAASAQKKKKQSAGGRNSAVIPKRRKTNASDIKGTAVANEYSEAVLADITSFKPTCARLIPYDPNHKASIYGEVEAMTGPPTVNLERGIRRHSRLKDTADPKATSRAARASQRRIMKGVAAIIKSRDALAGREETLRFGRSGIHAWGVFADEEISAGEMILEYRGEIIGNAMAEKREKEYEKAKLPDYMFRIDAHTVCDATHQGNVARFINASCNPNCYTKIVTLDGSKKIVIYAKCDIMLGDELCYDYKFPLEYDESKRIRCYCGSHECRGFMNWDKKFIALEKLAVNTQS